MLPNPLFIAARSRTIAWTVSIFFSFFAIFDSVSAQAGTACHTYQSGATPPDGYGAVWKPLTSAREVLLNSYCSGGAGNSVEYRIGTGNESHYIYSVGYFYTDRWNSFTLTGTAVSVSPAWLLGTASYTNQNPPTYDHFWVGYICQWQSGTQTWKCGCRDRTCATSYWQLQKVKSSSSGGTTGATASGGGTTGGASGTPGCLGTFNGSLTKLNQNYGYNTTKIATWPDNARYDARGGKWTSLINYTERNNTAPIQLGADWGTNNDKSGRRDIWSAKYDTPPRSESFCWHGGLVLGTQPLNATWGEVKRESGCAEGAPCAGGGYAITINGGPGSVVEGMRVHNHHDGFVPYHSNGFIYRGNWLSYIRDDCIENDAGANGSITDNLFDGCYVFYSNAGSGRAHGADGTVRFTDNLVKMEMMPGPCCVADGIGNRDAKGYGTFFKIRPKNVEKNVVPNIIIRDNIFAFEDRGRRGFEFIRAEVPIVECSNNLILYFGESAEFQLSMIPSTIRHCFTIQTGNAAKQRWEQERQRWIDAHSDIPTI